MTPKSHSNSRPANEPSEPLQTLTHRLTDFNCSPAKQPANDLKLTLPKEQDNVASPRSCSPVDSHAPVQTDMPLQVSTPMPGILSTPVKRGPGRPPKKVNFNFMPKEPPVHSTSMPIESVPLKAPQAFSPLSSPTPPSRVPSNVPQAMPRRSQRIRQCVTKYDASTGKWSRTSWYLLRNTPNLGGCRNLTYVIYLSSYYCIYLYLFRLSQHEYVLFGNK